MAAEKERAFAHWLCRIEGIGRRTARRLLETAGSAEHIYNMEEEQLKEMLGEITLQRLLHSRERADVMKDYRRLTKQGIQYIPSSDPCFPNRLLQIPDGPVGIYVLGKLPEETAPAAAVIGARVCSQYGSFAARQFTKALAGAGVNIISGLARGIDGISQEEALRQGGHTFAVLGCGVDVCYPAENRPLYDRIREHGGILSEYPPGTQPRAGLFPQRNRIISALSDLVLVIEAREKSGTLITVDMALEQGREVYAVPGRITDSLSLGCNRLIMQGAGSALSPQMLVAEIERITAAKEWGALGGNVSVERSVAKTDRAEPETDRTALKAEQADKTSPKKAAVPERLPCRGSLSSSAARFNQKEAVLNRLDFLPMSAGQLHEKMNQEGVAISLPALMQILMELALEEKCGQDGGYFYRK